MLHSQILPTDNHPFYKWTYASASARLAETALVTEDCGKVAWETDTNSFWVLTSVRPITWIAIGTAGAPATSLNVVNAIVARDGSGNFSAGTINAAINGNLAGNADTASRLANARMITLDGAVSGSASFNGTTNITITTAMNANSIVLGTDTAGDYVAAGAVSGNGLSGSASGEGSTFTVSSNATANSSPSTIVFRDASSNFAANEITATKFIGPITGNISGNADTATKWATARTITVTGSNSGTVTIDGSTNATLTLNPVANAITLGADTSGSYIESGAVSGNGLSGSASGEGSTFTVTSNATSTNTPSTIVYRDASGNFSANEITATKFIGPIQGSITGTSGTADKLTTARTITLTGDVNGSTSFDGSANVSIATTITVPTVILGTGTFGDYVANIGQGTGVTVTNGTGAGSSPTISIGQDVSMTAVPTFAGVVLTGNSSSTGNFTTTMTITASAMIAGAISLSAGTTSTAPLRIPQGVDPTTPVNGDIWTTTGGLYSHLNGTTVSILSSADATTFVARAGDTMLGDLTINGALSATTKNFLITHPTKPNMTLRYGSLEGPENGVYIRGKTTSSVIELPEYWTKLVDPGSITVSLTAIGSPQTLIVAGIWDNKVFIINSADTGAIDCYYHIFAERCDVEKLQVEAPDRRV